MSNLPFPNNENIQIFSNEFVTNTTVNRNASRLLANDLWLESVVDEISSTYITNRVSRTEFDTLSTNVDTIIDSTDEWTSVYSTVHDNSGAWLGTYFNDSCSYYFNTTVVLSHGVSTKIEYNINVYDFNSEYSNGVFTFSTTDSTTGYFLVIAGLLLPGSSFSGAEFATLELVRNGINFATLDVSSNAPFSTSTNIYLNGSIIVPLVNSDTISIYCTQNSNSSVSTTTNITANIISIQRLK